MHTQGRKFQVKSRQNYVCILSFGTELEKGEGRRLNRNKIAALFLQISLRKIVENEENPKHHNYKAERIRPKIQRNNRVGAISNRSQLMSARNDSSNYLEMILNEIARVIIVR
jgi:hypothetical protein